jgi:hypothetical protein
MKQFKRCEKAYLFSMLLLPLLLNTAQIEPAFAQNSLPRSSLDQMILQLNEEDAGVTASLERSKEFEQLRGLSYDAGSRTDGICDMQHFSLRLTNDRTGQSNVFSVLLDRQAAGSTIVPKQLLALTSVLHVDADGSPRAYHPGDPAGEGACKFNYRADGDYFAEGVCALDRFSNGGIKLFRGTRKLSDSEFGSDWKELWSQIHDRKIRPLNIGRSATIRPQREYYSFHFPKRKLTVFFKQGIIPRTAEGYPCTYGTQAPFPGYLVSATTLVNSQDQKLADGFNPAVVAPNECMALRYVNAERIPFFVLPGGHVGEVKIGDIVIAYATVGSVERVVYGIVGDAGPTHSFGEGSIALLQEILGKRGQPVMNSRELNELDINKDAKITVGILILGSTKELLESNYSRENIDAVGKREFERWGQKTSNPLRRLTACIAQARVNPR